MRSLRHAAAIGLLASGFFASAVGAQPLTADRAVEIALKNNSQVIGAKAGVLEAKGDVYGAASGVLPDLTIGIARSGSFTDNSTGQRFVGNQIIPGGGVTDIESYSTSPTLSSSWNVINLSSISSYRAARTGLGAAKLTESATRNDVALVTRRQFYEVVRAIHLSDVARGAVRLARDDERRVQALYEVGSVSKSDLLKAQVRRAQSELDSLTANQAIVVQRIVLANQIGVPETQLGELDTVLTVEPRTFDEPALLAEAERGRPDMRAAEANLRAANGFHSAARLARLPFVNVSGSVTLNPKFSQSSTTFTSDSTGAPVEFNGSSLSEDDREWRGTVSLNWNLFDLGTDSRVASARGAQIRARVNRDALRRDLSHQVHQALFDYSVALERYRVGQSAVASATENLNLTQQKYNVGSATILELIDAQVQLQRARSDEVTALASIRVAEAQIDRVRGRPE